MSDQKKEQQVPLRLTGAEKRHILEQRELEKQRQAKRKFQLKALQIAARWARWSKKNGEGLTYSTFNGQFGYDDDDFRAMYYAVEHILKAAREV